MHYTENGRGWACGVNECRMACNGGDTPSVVGRDVYL